MRHRGWFVLKALALELLIWVGVVAVFFFLVWVGSLIGSERAFLIVFAGVFLFAFGYLAAERYARMVRDEQRRRNGID